MIFTIVVIDYSRYKRDIDKASLAFMISLSKNDKHMKTNSPYLSSNNMERFIRVSYGVCARKNCNNSSYGDL